MWAEKVAVFIYSPITWGFVALLLAAIAISGRLSMTAANILLIFAFAIGCFGIFRSGLGLHISIIFCLLLGIGLTLISWWIQPSLPQPKQATVVQSELPKIEPPQKSTKIRTLHELFLGDFKKTRLLGEYHLNTKQKDIYTIEYIIWCDFDTKTKYLSIFLPKSDKYTFDACQFLIPRYQEIINGNIKSLMKGMIYHAPGEKEESYDELKFSGRLYIYHETRLLSSQIDSLTEDYKKHGLSPQFRGRDYLIMKNSPIYDENVRN